MTSFSIDGCWVCQAYSTKAESQTALSCRGKPCQLYRVITEVGAEAWWLPGNTKSKRVQGAHGGSRTLGFLFFFFFLVIKSVCARVFTVGSQEEGSRGLGFTVCVGALF